MKKEIDNKLNLKNIKPTAMRQLVLQVLTEQKTAISLPELEQKFEQADKATLYRTLKTFAGTTNSFIRIDDGSGSVEICALSGHLPVPPRRPACPFSLHKLQSNLLFKRHSCSRTINLPQ
jgi:Fe2+ or Zn2+ uptake regulation protein